MESEHNKRLSASEVAQIWSAYMNSSMCNCLFTYFLEVTEDSQIHSIIKKGLELSETHLAKLSLLFQKEGYAIPNGFKVDEDVNISAPRLFSDSLMMYLTHNMGMMALSFYAIAKTFAVRLDLDDYFTECVNDLSKFNTNSKNLLLSKGLYIRSPFLTPSKEVHFVKSDNFLSGLFGKKRPLTAVEITNLFANLQKNALGRTVMMAWSQVTQSKEVKQFMVRGKEIASKHTKVFGSVLEEEGLPVSLPWDVEVTDSEAAPFSDKMMMFMATTLTALSIGYYGTSMATSARKDLAIDYVRLSAEIALFAEDGAKIMIENGWLEEPPLAKDSGKL
ncbi:DUF3231 family protein [Bacillus salipaludis]|uniref:DUF3231 family protein n=1 Tax=Bacillus salipaludis TaxID=2547811 RepID=A0AA90TWM2_9BACI|nr:DUF3231 family protein [Bacillus salipaludis]MDQ6600861.1 DUF3231 family protein [Bacillus salipaludis]